TTASPGVTPVFLSLVISLSSSLRIVAPMALPSIRLAGNDHRPCLPNHDHLDLSRVLQLALDFARDLVRQPRRRRVVDRIGRHHDPDFPTRLNREDLVHALE